MNVPGEALTAAARGRFTAPDEWDFSAVGSTGMMFGHMCPLLGDAGADDFTVDVKAIYSSSSTTSDWIGLFVAAEEMGNKPYTNTVVAGERGYNCLIRKNGQIGVYLRADGSTVTSSLSSTGAVAITDSEEIDLRLVVTPT